MAQTFVDRSEVIEVEQNHTKRRLLTPIASHCLRQTLHEQHAVWQTCERVVQTFAAGPLDPAVFHRDTSPDR